MSTTARSETPTFALAGCAVYCDDKIVCLSPSRDDAMRIFDCLLALAGVADPSVVPDLLAMVRSLSDELREYAPDVRNEQLLTKADALLAKAVAGGVAPGGEGGGNG